MELHPNCDELTNQNRGRGKTLEENSKTSHPLRAEVVKGCEPGEK